MQWLWEGIFAGMALRLRQCVLEQELGMSTDRVMFTWRECTLRMRIFLFIIENDQSDTTKSHMFNTSLKLANYKCLTAK